MKKLKSITLFVLIITLISSLSVQSASLNPGVMLNGKMLTFNDSTGYPFVDESSRTQVPLRASMEAMGCIVEWDEASYSVYISKDNTHVTVPIGEYYIIKNGIKLSNDTTAQIINGRTYLPIRAVYEALGACVTWNSNFNCVEVNTVSSVAQVLFIDVGQGDSSLIDIGTYEVLIDAGDTNSGDTVVNTVLPYIDGLLDLVIATHPDSDHIGGMPEVFDKFTVGRVIDSGYTSSTKAYSEYSNNLNSEGCVISFDGDEIITLEDGAYIRIIETGDRWQNSNDMSVVCELVYGDTSVLFTGDISSKVEDASMMMYHDIDVLKVAHHGSSTSTGQSFLNTVRPEYAVVSAGLGNRYGHPKSDTLTRLINSGTKVLGTYKSGTVILSLNKDGFNFNNTDYLTVNDAGDKYANTNDNTAVESFSGSYVGNSNSFKFHSSSCTYVAKTKTENKVYFLTRTDAVNAGYLPCKVCNP